MERGMFGVWSIIAPNWHNSENLEWPFLTWKLY